ncbi:ParA family protein [Flavobacterium zhairuonense]|uniref:ParA family protein n=1 Tax=Flavobacterium zhairuonense TaxID=2493631 RepID=UPI001045816D|nr:ParA family protein [Flavobacterium zhairuonense]KAF2508586.1 ParA family protein [Flavobacterium zhairuonense]
MKTISFINMKGGVGKTTSVVEIGALLAKEHKKKVLIIDLDPQTNATLSLISLNEWEGLKDDATIKDVLGMNRATTSRDDEYDIRDAIIENVGGIKNLDLIPSHLELTFLDLDLGSVPARESILQNKIESANFDYDFILIDCPPNLTIAPQNALIVSDYIIVPVTPEIFPAIGLPLLINRVNKWKKSFKDCKVEFLGVLFTKVDGRYSMHAQQMDILRKGKIIPCFSTIIKQNADIGKAIAEHKPATISYPNCLGVQGYRTLVREILGML